MYLYAFIGAPPNSLIRCANVLSLICKWLKKLVHLVKQTPPLTKEEKKKNPYEFYYKCSTPTIVSRVLWDALSLDYLLKRFLAFLCQVSLNYFPSFSLVTSGILQVILSFCITSLGTKSGSNSCRFKSVVPSGDPST